jgi:hypothetical protein
MTTRDKQRIEALRRNGILPVSGGGGRRTLNFRQRFNRPRIGGKIQLKRGERVPRGIASAGGGSDH